VRFIQLQGEEFLLLLKRKGALKVEEEALMEWK